MKVKDWFPLRTLLASIALSEILSDCERLKSMIRSREAPTDSDAAL